jgi:hypothetical protein
MEWKDFMDELERLTASEDALSVSKEVSALKVRFDDFVLEEERKEQIAHLNATETGEAIVLTDFKSLKEPFINRYNLFLTERKRQEDLKKLQESENARRKYALIKRLQDVILNEEHIAHALNAYKEIQEEWKSIGAVERTKRDEIQKEYSKLLEQFFYNLKIYRELKEHDIKRNTQLKQGVIQQLKDIEHVVSIKDVESRLRQLQNEWEDIGPVQQEEWEQLKTVYWETVRAVYTRINHHYEEKRSEQHENLLKKQQIIDDLTAFLTTLGHLNSAKSWDQATKQVLAWQANWKLIGVGTRKESDQLWKAFRALCDQFFDTKKQFYGQIQAVFDQVVNQKMKLIEEAEAIKTSTDWKTTSEKFIQLQKKWKTLGHAGQKHEQRLWSTFRASCDYFFNAKQAAHSEIESQLVENLKLKQAFIEQINQTSLPESKEESIKMLQALASQFNAIGQVPSGEKDQLHRQFKSALDKHYAAIKLEGDEKELILFEAKLATMASSPDAFKMYQREKSDLRHQIEKLNQDIIQYENNLGFFAKSKGADALRKDVDHKIEQANQRIVLLKRKLKLIPNE